MEVKRSRGSQKKFGIGDLVSFMGKYYPKHKGHQGKVEDVVSKVRENYMGTAVAYIVLCVCGSTLRARATELEMKQSAIVD